MSHRQNIDAQDKAVQAIADKVALSAQRSQEIVELQNRVQRLNAESVEIAGKAYELREPQAVKRASALESELFQSTRLLQNKENEVIRLADEVVQDKIKLEELKELAANRRMRSLEKQIRKDLKSVTECFADLVLAKTSAR